MEFSQLVLVLTLALGGGTSQGHSGAAAEARAAVRADPGRDGREDRVPARRTLPRANEREQLAAGLLFGVAAPGRTR
jgi:hypothetical protein